MNVQLDMPAAGMLKTTMESMGVTVHLGAITERVLGDGQKVVNAITQGDKIAQLSLVFGVNDLGSLMLEENVVSQAGAQHSATEEDLRRMIRDAGFIPKQRDTLYRAYYLN